MRAMVFHGPGRPLLMTEAPDPVPGPGEALIAIEACGVCRTDLHIVDGELTDPALPLIPGHEIVGRIVGFGPGEASDGLRIGQRVGVPWLGHTCNCCSYCTDGRENLCDAPLFTGYTRDGGYADLTVADRAYVFPLSEEADPVALAPLMCAGLIGYRSLRLAGPGKRFGLYGFGAAAHILAQLLLWQDRQVYAVTRDGDSTAQALARKLGVTWVGGASEPPPVALDAALIFAPVGALVPAALRAVRKGGRVVCGGIHMSDIPSFPYADLWQERQILSVANLTRVDGLEFLPLAVKAGVQVSATAYPLARANDALDDLRAGRLAGAAVLRP